MLKNIFGFAKHRKKTTFGLVLKLTLRRNKNAAVVHKAVAIADARVKNE